MSIIIISAFFPFLRQSHSSRPIAFAPSFIAILRTLAASTAVGSFSLYLAKAVTRNISLNISRQLLLAGPSVPIPTFIPDSIYFAIGAMPLTSLRFDAGFVMTETFRFFKISISLSETCTPW